MGADGARSAPPVPMNQELILFGTLGALGVVASYLAVQIPHTDAFIEGRFIFGFMGFALLHRWWLALALAALLSGVGFHPIPWHICFLGNMLYAGPALLAIHLVHHYLLSRYRNPLLYGLGWFTLVMICYQLFNTPVVWAVLAALEDLPVGAHVLSGWKTQPFLFESLLVGLVSASGMTALRIHGELRQSRRELAITLDSIGDGVIATDSQGRILRINPAAQTLTGWTGEAAQGQPLSRVFRIVNARTGQPVDDPVARVIQSGKVVGLANHTVLISRDGTRRQIADSAAPVQEADGRLIGTVMVFRDVSREYMARESLQKSQAMLARTERMAGVGSWQWEIAGETIVWSDQLFRLFGRDPEKGAPSHSEMLRLYHPADSQRLQAAVQRAMAHGTPYELELRPVLPDQRLGYFRVQGYPQRDSQGTIVGLYGFVQDITERKQAEAAYQRICQMATELICVLDRKNYAFIQVNPAVERLLGYSEAELSGRSFLEWVHHHDRDLTVAILDEKGKQKDAPISFETRYGCKDGSFRHLEWNTHPVAEEGKVYAIGHDLTERKQAEQALRENEEKYRALIMQSTECLLLHDFEARIREVNPCSCRTYGYSREALLSMNIRDLVPEDAEAPNEGWFPDKLEPGKSIMFETRQQKKDGTVFPVEVRLSLIRLGQERLLLALCNDISERREKEKLEARFHQSQKLESVGRLAGGVAHDLNNMLSPILGYAEMLRDDLDGENQDAAQEIINAAMRARDLVRQLLAFSRKQILKFQPLDLNEVVGCFEKLLRRTIREDVDIRTALEPSLPLVEGDPGQLEQVIMNLAVNAADAMPDGGTLTIETAALDASDPALHPGMEPGKYGILRVGDTGSGIDPELQAHLFEPFFTTKAADKGTGLGLATVYGIVRQHSGHIQVDSQPGLGSCFQIYLPASDKSHVLPKESPRLSANLQGTERVLLVEDNQPVRELVQLTLRRRGYSVLSAEDGRAALRLLERNDEPVELLLTDVIMPEMSGRALYERIAQSRPDIRVLYMSGYPHEVIAHRGVIESGTHFIQKPFSLEALAAKLREVIEQPAP